MAKQNPILPGFNPDPSICRVGSDYYIATSTFEWYPGVRIYHSTDLANWTLVARPLNRPSLLDMRGEPDSCGVWAPCISYSDGLFYLCYTDVKRFDGNFKDTHNYLTTCATIDGEWSDPVYLNSSGFDPSLYHDTDGRKWLLNMVWDHRPDRSFFGGIMLQEFDPTASKLIGKPRNIYPGTELGFTEGPHIYRHNGYYYLMLAEGGTGYDHAVSVVRSQQLEGPWQEDPLGPVLTTADKPESQLQRCGHASLTDTPDGRWFMPHLCSRPLPNTRRSPLGRETALQELVYTDDGWFRLKQGGNGPEIQPEILANQYHQSKHCYYNFNQPTLHRDLQWLRTPYPETFMSLSEQPGKLRLIGKEALGSWFNSALIARRQTDFTFTATTCVSFSPENFQQMAGLTCYYNSHKFYYLYIGYDEQRGKILGIISCSGDQSLITEHPIIGKEPTLDSTTTVWLRAAIDGPHLQFWYSFNGENWQLVGPQLDASILSDEAGKGEGGNFTGAFVGLCCQDSSGQNQAADFSFFEYTADA